MSDLCLDANNSSLDVIFAFRAKSDAVKVLQKIDVYFKSRSNVVQELQIITKKVA